MLVSGGAQPTAIGVQLSKPISAMSPGIRRSRRRSVSATPRAIWSLPQRMASTPGRNAAGSRLHPSCSRQRRTPHDRDCWPAQPLTDWPLIKAYHFIGLANYQSLIHNTVFLQSIVFTLKYTAIVTVPIFVLGYALTVFVRSNRPGSTLFRTMIFLPYIVGLVAESYKAVVELQPDSGTANFVLAKFGIVSASTAWLVPTGLALTAISILVVWFASGLTMMLLMAGMQGIPHDVYESARVDGASWWRIERRLTIPLLRRSIALSLIISVVGSFLAFNQFFIMTDGGPGTSTVPVVMSIFDPSPR